MNYPSYFQKPIEPNQAYKAKAQQNKPNTLNVKRPHEQDPQTYIVKGSDSFEVKDLKGKMKTVMQKLATNRK